MAYDPNSVALPPPDVYPPLENENLLANPGQPQVEVNPPTVGQFGQPSFGAIGGIPYLFGGVNPTSGNPYGFQTAGQPQDFSGNWPGGNAGATGRFGRAVGRGALGFIGGPQSGLMSEAGSIGRWGIGELARWLSGKGHGSGTPMRGEEFGALSTDPTTGQPTAPQQRSPLLSGLFGNFGGTPINQANWQTYNTPGPSGYSPRQLNLARSGADISQMNTQTQLGFGSNFTGNTQDAGHDIFNTGPNSHFAGRIVDGVLTRVPNSQINRPQFQSEAFGNFADPATWAAHGAQPYPSQTPAIDPALAASLGFTTSAPPIASLPPSPAGYGGLM